MAKTATINCTIGQNQSKYQVYIEYTHTQDQKNNQTKISAALKLKQLTDSYDFDTGRYSEDLTVGFVMNGKPYSYTGRININDVGNAGYVKTLVSSGEVIIPHNNDGTKKITFSCNNIDPMLGSGGYGPGNITLSSTTITLPTIPRAATLDKVTNSSVTTITSIAAGNKIRMYYTLKSTAYFHRMYCYIGSSQKYYTKDALSSDNGYVEVTVDPSWIQSSSATLTCKLYTYTDSTCQTKIGNQNKDITVTIPDTSAFKPTPTLTITPSYGHNLGGDFYLQGISSVTVTADATPGTGATLSSLSLTGGGIYETSTGKKISKTSTISESGTIEYVATATDSRQCSAQAKSSISILPYCKPSHKAVSVARCNSSGTLVSDGTYALCTIQCVVQSINVSGEKNPYKVSVKYREEGLSTWSDFAEKTDIAPTTITVNLTNSSKMISAEKTYKFQITITDALGQTSTTKELTIRGSQRPINISRNNTGVAIGGLSTSDDRNPAMSGLFEVMWPMETHNSVQLLEGATINNGATINGKTTINNGITINNGTTINGGCAVSSTITARAANTQEGYAIVTRKTETDEGNGAYSDGIYLLSAITEGTSYKLGIVGKYNRQQIGGAITWHTSDVRLKENIEKSDTNALDAVSQMQIRQFDWKGGKHQHIGFVADELEQIDPLLAIGGGYLKDGSMNIKSIDTLYLLGYVTKAVQELAEQNKELREKVQLLESKINLKE